MINFHLDLHNCETCQQAWERMEALSDEDGEFDLPDGELDAIKTHVRSAHPDLQRKEQQ